MAFLGPNDILVLEKSQGTVQRIVNGKMASQPLLQVPLASRDNQGCKTTTTNAKKTLEYIGEQE
jgi:hypothetical protein